MDCRTAVLMGRSLRHIMRSASPYSSLASRLLLIVCGNYILELDEQRVFFFPVWQPTSETGGKEVLGLN